MTGPIDRLMNGVALVVMQTMQGMNRVKNASRAAVSVGMKADGPIVVFDTNCVLCSGMVAFVLAHEQAPVLRFAGAWSIEGLALAATYGFSRSDLDETFLVVCSGKVLMRSDAGIEIARHFSAPWRWVAIMAYVPRPLRDAAYKLVARRRYRWFGRRQDCTVVPLAERHRFIGVSGLSDTASSLTPALQQASPATARTLPRFLSWGGLRVGVKGGHKS